MRDNTKIDATEFVYLYRDGSNFKAYGNILLSGILSFEDHRDLLNIIGDDLLFVAEQVDIPTLYDSLFSIGGGPTLDDHGWHEFVGLSEVTMNQETEFWYTSESLMSKFRSIDTWDVSFSPNFLLGSGLLI